MKSEQKASSGEFFLPSSPLNLTENYFSLQNGGGGEGDLKLFFKSGRNLLLTCIQVKGWDYSVLHIRLCDQPLTTYYLYLQNTESNHLLLKGKKYSAPLPGICQWYKERFLFSVQKSCLLPLNMYVVCILVSTMARYVHLCVYI